MARAARLRAFVYALWSALAIACVSPTLPLPPPSPPSISTGTEPDTWKLRSINGAAPNALVIAVNRDTSLPRDKRVTGTIADENGSWDLEIVGKAGDYIDLSQESGTTSSPSTTIQLK